MYVEKFDVEKDEFDKSNSILINNNINFLLNDTFKKHVLDFFTLNNI